MRPEPNHRLDEYRRPHPQLGNTPAGANHGFFRIGELRVISSGTPGPDDPTWNAEIKNWEHVSVSVLHRIPSWEEMCRVKELFWADDETVVQFHPRKSEYVNAHPHCLHLWKQVGVEVKLPPRETLA